MLAVVGENEAVRYVGAPLASLPRAQLSVQVITRQPQQAEHDVAPMLAQQNELVAAGQ